MLTFFGFHCFMKYHVLNEDFNKDQSKWESNSHLKTKQQISSRHTNQPK